MQMQLRVHCQQGACLLSFSQLVVQRLLFRLNFKVSLAQKIISEEEDRPKEILSIFKVFLN